MRTSPIYIECRCREIEEIKKNLSVAVETIHSLREENVKIKEMLQMEYQEKLSSLQNECVYLQFNLKQAAQKKEATAGKGSRMTVLCHQTLLACLDERPNARPSAQELGACLRALPDPC